MTQQTPHEQRVAEIEDGRSETPEDPTSDEDLAADRGASEQEPEQLD